MPGPDEAQISEWKAQYGQVYELRSDQGGSELVFFCRKPGRAQINRFISSVTRDTFKAACNLIFDCLLWPSREAMEKIIDDEPGVAVALANQLQELAGTNRDFTTRPL